MYNAHRLFKTDTITACDVMCVVCLPCRLLVVVCLQLGQGGVQSIGNAGGEMSNLVSAWYTHVCTWKYIHSLHMDGYTPT